MTLSPWFTPRAWGRHACPRTYRRALWFTPTRVRIIGVQRLDHHGVAVLSHTRRHGAIPTPATTARAHRPAHGNRQPRSRLTGTPPRSTPSASAHATPSRIPHPNPTSHIRRAHSSPRIWDMSPSESAQRSGTRCRRSRSVTPHPAGAAADPHVDAPTLPHGPSPGGRPGYAIHRSHIACPPPRQSPRSIPDTSVTPTTTRNAPRTTCHAPSLSTRHQAPGTGHHGVHVERTAASIRPNRSALTRRPTSRGQPQSPRDTRVSATATMSAATTWDMSPPTPRCTTLW